MFAVKRLFKALMITYTGWSSAAPVNYRYAKHEVVSHYDYQKTRDFNACKIYIHFNNILQLSLLKTKFTNPTKKWLILRTLSLSWRQRFKDTSSTGLSCKPIKIHVKQKDPKKTLCEKTNPRFWYEDKAEEERNLVFYPIFNDTTIYILIFLQNKVFLLRGRHFFFLSWYRNIHMTWAQP